MPLPSLILLGTPHDIEPGDLWRPCGPRRIPNGVPHHADELTRPYMPPGGWFTWTDGARSAWATFWDEAAAAGNALRPNPYLVEIVRGAA